MKPNVSVPAAIAEAYTVIHLDRYSRRTAVVRGKNRYFDTAAEAQYLVRQERIKYALVLLGYKVAENVLPVFRDRRTVLENVNENITLFNMAKESNEQIELF